MKPRKLGELELRLSGLAAVATPQKVTVPKNTASGIRVSVRAGASDLPLPEAERLLGGPFSIEGDLAGPGLRAPLRLPQTTSPDPLLLIIPPLPTSGNYTLSNLRLTVNGATALDINPNRVDVEVIEQVLITSVTTRPLTLEEIQAKGIILDNDSYLGFEFTLGMSMESSPVNFTFPVIFDKRGVAVPQPLLPGGEPERAQMPPLTTIVPMLLEPKDGQEVTYRMANGKEEPVRIPSVLVIPGNVGYLKQFFSAKLYVANGAPGASNLSVHDIKGKIKLPAGADKVPGSNDDPLMLPDTTKGPQLATQPVVAAGADGEFGTADDVISFRPGEQGQAEFLLRGEKEGFHTIDFDIEATLDGLVTGPVTVTGAGSGGVLVRNPYFDMTFTAPSVVRQGERFKLYVTVNNISQSMANDVRVTLDGARMSGAHLAGDPTQTIATLLPRDSRMLEFDFIADRTGQVVATYLNLDTQNGSSGTLKFTLAVGERGIPLSPDTLVLPAAVDHLPQTVVAAAMRVLGQGWSIANAPSGTLPQGVLRTSRGVVTQKALALAEAGLRTSLGQPVDDAVRDLLFDFYGGAPVDGGFDQLLRSTAAGTELARAIGNALKTRADLSGGIVPYEREIADVAASGAGYIALAVNGAVNVSLNDGTGKVSAGASTFDNGQVLSAVSVPLGTAKLVLIPSPNNGPYTFELTATGASTADLSLTHPAGDTLRRRTVQFTTIAGARYRLAVEDNTTLQIDANADGTYETTQTLSSETIHPQGPRVISAHTIGPETLDGAAPFGMQAVVLFDRIVDATTGNTAANYSVARNKVLSAKRQLSGRLVFATLEQPEGPYVGTQLSVNGVRDLRNVAGPAATVTLASRLADIGAVVTGRILDADGTPIGGAIITYAQNPELLCAPPLGDLQGLAAMRTGDDGRYELRYVRQDRCGMAFQLATRDPNTGALRSVSSSVRAAGEQIVLDIAMLGRGSVTGIVRGLTGQPVAGATVVALSQTDSQSHGSAMSDTSGRYRIDNLIVGAVTVRAVKDASLGKSFGRIDRAGTAATVDLTLDGGTVSARGVVRRVQGSDVQPIPNQQVVYRVRGNDGSFIPVALATTDTTGKYTFSGLPTGEYIIDAALNSRDKGSATGIAGAGDVVVKDIAVVIGGDGYGTVRGVVRFPDGSAATDVVVSVDDRGVLTKIDGSFELVGLLVKPTTQQTIKAQSRDGLRSGSTLVTISQPNQLITNVAITLSGAGAAEFTLLDASRNPVANQEVTLLGGCWNPCGCAARTTNSEGKVRFENVALGTVRARAIRQSSAFTDQADTQVALTADGATVYGVLVFPGSGTITGTVLNPDGTPALGADIRLGSKVFDEDSCSLVGGTAQRIRTDVNGKFRFTQVNVGQVSVTATHPFFTTSVGGSGTLTAHGASLDFQLKLVNTISGILSGTVYLPDGVTPAGAGVEVTAVGPLPETTVTTDANGKYTFAKIFPEGSYTLTARDAVTGGLRRDSIYLRASQDVTHDLRLKGHGTVVVRVVDGGGNPVTKAFVRLEETQFPSRVYEAALEPSSGGTVTFDNVFEGPLTAQASDAFARGGRSSSTLSGPGATLEMTVALTTTGTVRGKFVRADGVTPIPFGSVKLVANNVVIGTTTTAGNGDVGTFSFTYVPAGSFRLEAQDPQTARSGVAVGTIGTEGEAVDVTVVAQGIGRVTGLVTSNGAAQPGAHVRISNGNFDIVTFADSTGRYSIDGVPEGRVNVTASLAGNFLTGTTSGMLAGEAQTLTLDVALRDSGKLTGRVLAAGGQAAAPISLVTVHVGGNGGATLNTTTDTTGAFTFERVPAGYATLAAEVLGSMDKASGTADILGSQTTDVTLTLNGIGGIAGKALDSNGAAIAGSVKITGNGAVPYSFTVQAQADGVFTLPQVPAGPFSAMLTAKSGEFVLYGTQSGSVVANETLNLTVQIQPSGTVTGLVVRSNGTTPGVGANVVLQLDGNRGSVTVQAGNDGRFTARGVPFSNFTVRISDPLTTGLALSSGSITANGQTVDLGTLVLDDQPLRVVSITPADGSIGVTQTTPVVVTFSNQLQSAAGITVRNGAQTVNGNASLSTDAKTVTLTGTWPDSAELTVNVSTAVTDVFGRHPLETTTSRFHTIDLSGPKVASVVPAASSIQVAANTTITVTFDESLAASVDAANVVKLDGVTGTAVLTTPKTIVFTPGAPLADNATYTVKVNGAIDASGNVQTTPFTSTFATNDTVAPVLTVTTPAHDSWIRNAKPQIQVNAVDPISGIAAGSGALLLDGTAVTPQLSGATLYYTPAADLAQGVHTIEASLTDRAGNRGTVDSTFKIDTVAPTAAALSGVGAGATLRGPLSISGSASDATSGVAKIEALVDGSVFLTLTAPDFAAGYDSTMLAEGPHTFSVRAVDVAGNVSAVTQIGTAVVDNRPLTVAFTFPAQNTPVRDAASFTAAGSEPLARIDFSIANFTMSDDTSPYEASLDLTSFGEGAQVITATAVALSGETAQATRTVVIDRTAPSAPDASRINAEPPQNGSSLVFAYSGAVEPNANVELSNSTRPGTASTKAAADGTFSVFITAEIDDVLSLIAVDSVGNRSEASTITVRRTPSLPPSSGATSLQYHGLLADRVGTTRPLAEDGIVDAVFTLNLSIGDGLTRTISYIDLAGPLTRSTRAGHTPLAVAQDAGSTLLNRADGTINFPVTSGTTLTLFATDAGFIRDGFTYTVKAVFTDGTQFIDTYFITPREDRSLVAHSADVTAEPPTVVVKPGQPGTTTLTLTNIRDIDGTLVPDGAKLALSAMDMASKDPTGGSIRSAGGTIVGGEVAANNPNFRVFTISGGSVTATYSSNPLTPALITGATAVVQVMPADASDNTLGTDAISTIDLNIRSSADRAIVHPKPASLYADRNDRRSRIRIEVRDAAGNPVPDGTKVTVTVASNGSIIGGWWSGSAGGTLYGGTQSAQSSAWRVLTVSGGAVECEYSSAGLIANVGELKTVNIQVNPADANGNRTTNDAIGTGYITLAGPARGEIRVVPETVPYVFPTPAPVLVDVQLAQDTRAHLMPDGAKLLVSALNSASIVGGWWVGSWGGTIVDGIASPSGSGLKAFPLLNNALRATYSIAGGGTVHTGDVQNATIQLVAADSTSARIDNRALNTATVKVLGPLNSYGTTTNSNLFGDGALQTTTVRFSHILDVYGNPLPEGSKVVVSVANSQVIAGGWWVGSIGGQILNGTDSPTGTFKTFTITDGGIDVVYGNQGITCTPGERKTANVALAQAGANGERLSTQALGLVPITIVGTTSATAVASPSAFFSDGTDYRSTITVSNIKDALGRPVPDGTLVGVTAANSATISGGWWVGSAGGSILGGTVAPNNTAFKVFPVVNGQVVVQYSSQGVVVNEGERIATVQVASANQQGQILSQQSLGTVAIRLLSPASVKVAVDPVNLTLMAPSPTAQITITDLKSSDNLPLPDGTKVGLSVVNSAATYGGWWQSSVGGTLSPAGTTDGDGSTSPNNAAFQSYTIAGGTVRSVYIAPEIAAGVGETKIATVQVVTADRNGNVLNTRALGVAQIRLHGVTSASASGPATLKMPGTASVTFTNIKDAAGNLVPDGTPVAVAVLNNATSTGGWWNGSVGGTITNGNTSPTAGWKWMTVENGSVTVQYSSQGVTVAGTTRIQLVPAQRNGTPILSPTLSGGMWPINLTY
ncbi:MAG TPA: carboxypeptidase regulatory-like domain-containing protein [Thermoanaerobaculia bacterium]